MPVFTLRHPVSASDGRVTIYVTVYVNVYVNTGIDLTSDFTLNLIEERKQNRLAGLKEGDNEIGREDQEGWRNEKHYQV